MGVIENEAETPSHPTKVLIWYPALNPDGAEEAVAYDWDYDPEGMGLLPIAGHALKNAVADISGGPYPLVMYVHGAGGGRTGGIWLCEHLASYGFVVMSIDQDDNTATPGGTGVYQARLKDVTWQIDYADTLTSATGLLAGLIDTDRVAITGHSVGGRTAFEAGGIGGDPRIKAVVPLAPYGVGVVTDVTLPTMLLSGSKDEYLSTSNAQRIYDGLGSTTKAFVTFQFAHHTIFWYSCDAAPWYPPSSHRYCSDPVWDMDRVHDLANHFITAFLLDVLKTDEAARRFLTPGVKMEGVEYQATGF